MRSPPNYSVPSKRQNQQGCLRGSAPARGYGLHRNKEEVYSSLPHLCGVLCIRRSFQPNCDPYFLGLPRNSHDSLNRFMQTTFLPLHLSVLRVFPFVSTPETSKSPKAPKTPLFKTSKGNEIQACSHTQHWWQTAAAFPREEGRHGYHRFSHLRAHLGIPRHSTRGTSPLNRTPVWQSLLLREPDDVKRCRNQTPVLQGQLCHQKLPHWSWASLRASEPQGRPAYEARHGGQRGHTERNLGCSGNLDNKK